MAEHFVNSQILALIFRTKAKKRCVDEKRFTTIRKKCNSLSHVGIDHYFEVVESYIRNRKKTWYYLVIGTKTFLHYLALLVISNHLK